MFSRFRQAQPAIDFGDDAGDGGLAGPGRPGEDQVVRALRYREPALLAHQFHGHRTLQPRHLVLDLLQSDEFGELAFGLMQQDGLAFVGRGIDEIVRVGLGSGIPRIGAGVDPARGGGHDPEAGIGQGLLDLLVLGVGRVQILQDLVCRLLVDVRAQHQRFGQRAVHRRDGDRAVGLLEIRQRRGEHAQPGQRGAEGDLGRVGERLVKLGVVDYRRQQLDDVRPALGAVIDHDRDPAGLAPARAAAR